MVDDYFDLFKKVKNTKNDFEKLSIKFKELRSLAINYKNDKEIEKINKDLNHKFGNQNNFNQKIDELNQETETIIDEIEKWQT